MNKQTTYNKVREHLLTQNKKSEILLRGCAYRGDGNTMCSIGCLIPNELYSRGMEGMPVTTLLARYVNLQHALDVNASDVKFLSVLQNIHDMCHPNDWEKELNSFARTFSLVVEE